MGYPIPKNWAFDQFFELNEKSGKFSSTPPFDLDKDGYSGRDTGISSFDTVPYLTPDELDSDSSVVMLEALRYQFVYNVLEPLGYLNLVTTKQIEFNKEYYLTTYMANCFSFNISIESTNEVKFNFLKDPVQIALNNEEKLTAGCEANIELLKS